MTRSGNRRGIIHRTKEQNNLFYFRRLDLWKRRDFIKAGVIGLGAIAIADKAAALEFYHKSRTKNGLL
jgi:hypothetical protein